MILVPGMFVKFADTDTKALVVYSDGGSGVWLKEEGESVYRAEHPDSWVFTGELDWSMTPPLPIEYSFPTDPQWRKGTKVGYLPDMGFYIRRDNGGFTWMSPKYVRMPQPEPEIKEMPAINFETDPPKYGDEYIRRDGDIVKFIGIGFISEDKWIFENSVGSLGHYHSNGMYVRDCPDVEDIVSRKPAEPAKHKETIGVNFYASGFPHFFSSEQNAKNCALLKTLEDTLETLNVLLELRIENPAIHILIKNDVNNIQAAIAKVKGEGL